MSDIVNDEQAQSGATPEPPETPAKEYLNMEEATPDQLREAMQNPGKFTTTAPKEASSESGESEEGSEEEEEGKKSGAEDEGTETDSEEEEEEDKDHGSEVRPPTRNRVKVRAQHLSDAERDVLALISSKKISLPAAQEEVLAKLVRDGHSLKEAETIIYGGPGRRQGSSGGKSKASKEESEEEEAEKSNPLDEKQAEIDQIRADLKVAREAYEVDKIEELRDKLADAREDLRDLKATTRSAEEEAAHDFDTRVEASTARAIELFPDAANDGTELFDAIQDEVEDLKESDPDFFNNPKWPERLAAVKAAELGIPSSKQKGGATPQQGEQKRAVVPKKQARTLVPASGTSGGSSNRTSEPDPQAEFEAAGDDPEKLLAFVRKHGRRPKGLMDMADAFAN